jgi:hypothetical protein
MDNVQNCGSYINIQSSQTYIQNCDSYKYILSLWGASCCVIYVYYMNI